MDNSQKKIADDILRVRFSQMIINEEIKKKRFKIPIHLALGHEAIAVAVSNIMCGDDQLVLPHRNIHYHLARGRHLKPEIDEYLLNKNGVAAGRLGSMNLTNDKIGIVYTTSILGNNLSIACGLALAKRVQNSNGLVIVVLGDGAIEEGSFYEGLLFMKSQGLRVVVIVENNEWSLATRISQRRCPIYLDKYTAGLGIRYEKLQGNDVYQYISILVNIRNTVMAEESPVCVEAELTTLGGWWKNEGEVAAHFVNYHSGIAPTVNLNEEPILDNSERDPIFILRKYFKVQELEVLSKHVLNRLKEEINDLR